MRGLGTLVNVVAIVGGTLLGLAIGSRIPERVRTTLIDAVGLSVIVLGVSDALKTENLVFPLVSLVVGGMIGEALAVEERLEGLGERIRLRVAKRGRREHATFVEGFVNASLLFCVGPLMVLGSIADGLGLGAQKLVVKSALDGFVSVVFASTLGIGVAFSAISVGVLQGTVTALAGLADRVLTERMVTEMTATGGLMIVGIGVRLLETRRVRVGSLLPALLIAPVGVSLFVR
ncbi:MAG: DUF554 domain-containing protein [Actinomycetota bacterium]|nr:DUF554 domain-containing protein [Actinomycetota bacterium]